MEFDGTGTIAANQSFNHSSLTDNGTGDYSVTITNAMNYVDYPYQGACSYLQGTDYGRHAYNVGTSTSTTYKFKCSDARDWTLRDMQSVNGTVHGDLA